MEYLNKEDYYINSFLDEDEEILYMAPKLKSMIIFGWFLIIASSPCILFPFLILQSHCQIQNYLLY